METWLGGVAAGVGLVALTEIVRYADGVINLQRKSTTIGAEALRDNTFEVLLATEPVELWSACVDATGDVPRLTVKTTVGLIAVERADGTPSKGVLGGEKRDLEKALHINFRPAWQSWPA